MKTKIEQVYLTKQFILIELERSQCISKGGIIVNKSLILIILYYLFVIFF